MFARDKQINRRFFRFASFQERWFMYIRMRSTARLPVRLCAWKCQWTLARAIVRDRLSALAVSIPGLLRRKDYCWKNRTKSSFLPSVKANVLKKKSGGRVRANYETVVKNWKQTTSVSFTFLTLAKWLILRRKTALFSEQNGSFWRAERPILDCKMAHSEKQPVFFSFSVWTFYRFNGFHASKMKKNLYPFFWSFYFTFWKAFLPCPTVPGSFFPSSWPMLSGVQSYVLRRFFSVLNAFSADLEVCSRLKQLVAVLSWRWKNMCGDGLYVGKKL